VVSVAASGAGDVMRPMMCTMAAMVEEVVTVVVFLVVMGERVARAEIGRDGGIGEQRAGIGGEVVRQICVLACS